MRGVFVCVGGSGAGQTVTNSVHSTPLVHGAVVRSASNAA